MLEASYEPLTSLSYQLPHESGPLAGLVTRMIAKITGQIKLFAILLFLFCPFANAGSIEDLCRENAAIVAKAIALKNQNASMIKAEGLAGSIQNERLRSFLIESIHVAYLHPAYISGLVANGEWQSQCVAYVGSAGAE